MNAGTCWGKNTIDPRGRGVEKPREATLTFNLLTIAIHQLGHRLYCLNIFFDFVRPSRRITGQNSDENVASFVQIYSTSSFYH
jgi:hypothetical protein